MIGWVVGRLDGVPRWPVWPKGGDSDGWSDFGEERHTANPRGPVAKSPPTGPDSRKKVGYALLLFPHA